MNYEITPRSRAKDFSRHIHDKLEDSLFWILQKLPEKFIPDTLMHWSNVSAK